MASDIPSQDRRLRARFSLLTLLLLTAIVALSTTVAILWREIGPLRTENKRLNEERGTLVIDDPGILHAIKIPKRFAGDSGDSYRIYVPVGQEYLAFVKVNDVPKEGYPTVKNYPRQSLIIGSTGGQLGARLTAGEHVLAIRKLRSSQKRADVLLMFWPKGSKVPLDAPAHSPQDRWPSVEPSPYAVFGEGVESVTTLVDSSGRLVLLRRRIQPVAESEVNNSYATVESDRPLDGMMLWLERVK